MNSPNQTQNGTMVVKYVIKILFKAHQHALYISRTPMLDPVPQSDLSAQAIVTQYFNLTSTEDSCSD